VWDIEAPKEPLLATYGDHLDRVQAVDISPDDMMIASGSWDGTVRVRSLSDGTLIQQLDAGGPVSALSFANSIPRLTVATGRLFQEGGIRVWKTNTWELVVNNKLEHAVTALTFSTDGTVIATAIGRGVVVLIRPGQTPFLQRLDPPLELPKLAGITYPVPPRDTITAMSFLPSNSNLLAVVTLNGIISVWNVEDEMIIRNFSIEQPVLDLAFMADASQVAFGDLSGAIRVLATPPGLGTQ
jgi:WD40 repeat protein